MKIRKLLIIALLLLTACQKQSHPLSSISEITMNRILIFVEDKNDILTYYDLSEEKVYKTSFSKYGTAYQRFIFPKLKGGYLHV